jgi:hypothetical protein
MLRQEATGVKPPGKSRADCRIARSARITDPAKEKLNNVEMLEDQGLGHAFL